MKITYTVGARTGQTVDVDVTTGEWMIEKRRAVAVVEELATEVVEAPRVKRKYTRRAPSKATEDSATEGTEDEGTEVEDEA